jgi:hypothetical protein
MSFQQTGLTQFLAGHEKLCLFHYQAATGSCLLALGFYAKKEPVF